MELIFKKLFQNKSKEFKIIDNSRVSEVVNYLVPKIPVENIIFIGNVNKDLIENKKTTSTYSYIGNCFLVSEDINRNLTCIDFKINNGLPEISSKILASSIVVIEQVFENCRISKKFLKAISLWNKICPVILFTSSCELSNSSVLTGAFHGKLGNEHILLGGYLSNISYEDNDRPLRICAIISSYNEEDIIIQTCEYLLFQGIAVHVIDNWSTDTTVKKLEKLSKKHKLMSYELFPEQRSGQYQWFEILSRKTEFAIKNDYDWYIHYDADEIREGCWNRNTLKECIANVNRLGYNCIDHTVINFRPVNDGFDEKSEPLSFFNMFEFGRVSGDFVQIKAWKNIPGIVPNLCNSGGHAVGFEGMRPFPYKFLLKHYQLRSLAHMEKKIFQDRLPRFKTERNKYGWHNHYDAYLKSEKKVELWSSRDLTNFNENFYNDFLIERLTGLGLDFDPDPV